MTILHQYRSLRLEIEITQKRINKLNQEIDKLLRSETVRDSVRGGSGGNQHYQIEGFPYVSGKQHQLAQQVKILQERVRQENELVLKCEQYISSIPNSSDRMVCTLYFIDGLSMEQVSEKVYMARATVFRVVHKYL